MGPRSRNIRIILPGAFILVLLSSYILSVGDDPRLSRIIGCLSKFNKEYPQQKAYLQLDKTLYTAGEDIWFKAYLVNGTTHLPDTMSTNLVVQLVNARNIIVQSQLLKLKDGFAHGDFMLKDTVTEGNYLLKAYTVWMNNFDEAFIFTKNLYIKNPENQNFISADDLRFNRKFNRKQAKLKEKTDVQFLPEGGYLVYGLPCRIAFKALNGEGKSVELDGTIKDDKGNEVSGLHTLHAGMGAVLFKPERGRSYYAWVRLGNSDIEKIELPRPLDRGYTLQVDNLASDDFINVKIRSNMLPTADEYANDIILVGQTRGKLCYSIVKSMDNDSLSLSIPKKNFPTGIAQITLFNGRGLPVAERLAFVNHNDELNLALTRVNDSTTLNGRVKVQLKVTDDHGAPVKGNFSASVTSITESGADVPETNILSALWLTSDIRGKVENPGFYLGFPSPLKDAALDLLMMTNGWRRFDWNKMVSGQFPKNKLH